MGILSTAFSTEPTQGYSRVGGGFLDFFGFGGAGLTGANTKTALTLSAFFNGIDQLSNDVAKLPKYVLVKDGDNRNKFSEHPANILISQRPSGLMNAFDLWKIVDISTKLKGNAYVEIVRNENTGIIQNLIFRASQDVQILEDKDNFKLLYKYKGRLIDGQDMLHFKGFTLDGKTGVGVVTYAAAQLGYILSSQEFAGEVFGNKGLTYGVLETDKVFSDSVQKRKVSQVFSETMASRSVHRAPLLDEGMKYKSIGITPAEAQFLETNKHGVNEVARWLNIAPHKLKDLTNANYSNIYQQSIEHVQDSILPWVIRYEQELNNKLFRDDEMGRVYTKFNIASLLRGDLDMKQKYYTAAIYSGYMNRNEVRALEDMNPMPGLEEFLQPTNMQTLEFMMKQLKANQDDKNNTK